MAKELDAAGRLRLYTELVGNANLGAEIAYDERFLSGDWPRTAYALTLKDLVAVLDELDERRNETQGKRLIPMLRCNCGCSKEAHQGDEGLGGAQCLRCPGDGERGWRHPYTPTLVEQLECSCGITWENQFPIGHGDVRCEFPFKDGMRVRAVGKFAGTVHDVSFRGFWVRYDDLDEYDKQYEWADTRWFMELIE